jgi:cytochrome P450
MPFLDRLLVKNPIRLWCSDHGLPNTNTAVVDFAKARVAARHESQKTSVGIDRSVKRKDFLTRFLEAKEKDPNFIDDHRVLALTVANMFAGSDTTAITLRAIFYFLLKNPPQLRKLFAELQDTEAAGRLARSDGLVGWEEARDLPYLGACVKESMHLHPAVGLTLERIVPPQGIELCGHFLPGGTIVGCSAWALHAKESIFGADTNRFLPERWIDAPAEKLVEMNNALFSFGMGSRTCIDKNISLLEMFKLIPAVLRRFEVRTIFKMRGEGLVC